MPRPLQAHSGVQRRFHASLFAPTPPCPKWIPATIHTLVPCSAAQHSLWARGLAPKDTEEQRHFVQRWAQCQYHTTKKAPAARLHPSRRRKPASSQTHREKTHASIHTMRSAFTRVWAPGQQQKILPISRCCEIDTTHVFHFQIYLLKLCSMLHPSTIFDLNSLTSIRKLTNK